MCVEGGLNSDFLKQKKMLRFINVFLQVLKERAVDCDRSEVSGVRFLTALFYLQHLWEWRGGRGVSIQGSW